MSDEEQSLRNGLACMQAELANDLVNDFAQNQKTIAVEKEKKLEEIKKADESEKEKDPDEILQADLDQKYKNLLKKINKQTQLEDEGEESSQNGEPEESADEEDKKANDQLKLLYDASVSFKNDLSVLRSQIKNLNSKTTLYSTKCNDF